MIQRFTQKSESSVDSTVLLLHSTLHSSLLWESYVCRMQLRNCCVSVTKGDVVWARVQFPHQFWPSLVLCTDSLGVCVSFFNHNLSPRYVIESEVVPFEECFRWIMGHQKGVKKCDIFYGLLDSALKLMGRRVISSLKCRCQMMPPRNFDGVGGGGNDGRERSDGSKSNVCFQPFVVLGFVLRVAVVPWVDELDFVDAVRAVAQVQAFRDYCSIEKRMAYEKTQGGNDVKLLRCSSLGEKMHELSRVSDALEPQHQYQILSEEVEKILTIDSIKTLSSKTSVVKENVKTFWENQLQIIPQTHTSNREAELLHEISLHLHSLSFHPFYVMGESLQPLKLRLLGVKNISEQNILKACFKDCSKLSEAFRRRKDTAIELFYTLPNINTAACLPKKRKQLDHLVLCDCSFKLQKPSPFSSTNEEFSSLKMIVSGNKELNPDFFVLPSTLADCFASSRIEMDSHLASILPHPVKVSDLGLGLAYTGGCSLMNLPDNASCYMSLFKEKPCQIDFPTEERVQETEGNNHVSEFSTPCTSQTRMSEHKSIQKYGQSSICFHETATKFTEELNSGSLSDSLLGAQNSNNYEDEVEAKEVSNNGLEGPDSALDKKMLQISTSNKSARIKLSSRCCLEKNKNLDQFGTSCTMINSRVGEQLKTQASRACSKSLHMKFPKNINLPSKSELIKKFRVFGSVDYLKTKVFSFSSSARVSFLQEADAMAAYFHAKRKKVSLGNANIQFWLDPSEHKRRLSSKYCTPGSASEQPKSLKSCLKSSSSEKKDKLKKPYKVRFTIVT